MGAFALGQAMPNLEAISKGQGAAVKIFETIDRTSLIDSSSNTGKFPKKVTGSIHCLIIYLTSNRYSLGSTFLYLPNQK
jgi:hypothetical protein